MTAYCASNIPRLEITQTYFWDQTQGKFIGNSMAGPTGFTFNVDHSQFQISTRNCFTGVNESTGSVTMSPGQCYIATDNSSPVHFFLPPAGAGLVHGDCIKVAGYGSAGFDVTANNPQFIAFGINAFHFLSANNRYNQISFIYNKFSTNNFWLVFGIQGNFSGS